MDNVIIVTTPVIEGYKVVETFGEVFGQTTRSRNAFSSIGQGLKTIVGGELKGYTKLQDDARQQATQRLKEEAANLGANAVLMMRFDTTSTQLGDAVAAYGTAVRLEKQ